MYVCVIIEYQYNNVSKFSLEGVMKCIDRFWTWNLLQWTIKPSSCLYDMKNVRHSFLSTLVDKTSHKNKQCHHGESEVYIGLGYLVTYRLIDPVASTLMRKKYRGNPRRKIWPTSKSPVHSRFPNSAKIDFSFYPGWKLLKPLRNCRKTTFNFSTVCVEFSAHRLKFLIP